MSRPVIVACAVTGSADSTGVNPAVPVTPEEIANEAIAANEAGAAIAHIHVRNPETGKASTEFKYYEEVVKRIRDSGSPVIVNLTTGPGGRFVPDPANPMKAGATSAMMAAAERVAHIVELKPDICSLDVATMNFGEWSMVNSPAILRDMATMIQDAGVKPELEVFDTGHVRLAAQMCANGEINDPMPLFQLCLGISWGAPASTAAMTLMRDLLPENAVWASFGISRNEMPMVGSATLLGGHCRVGLEDNLYISRGKLASGNAELVDHAAGIIQSLGEQIATVDQACEILGLRGAGNMATAAA
ncbi:MAG: 3-keto-5-aminohexanoate cleavage protein [Alphaproteobacteria bacterium]|nr:3-keto-5-aminohexanoate cleavage protein [Alphaproteobacteria bacterium]